MPERDVHARELEHHEELYSGFAQQHFAKAGVRAFRAHLVKRMLRLKSVGPSSRVLSIGCGIGDTELMMAPRVGHLVGIDLSPTAIRQAGEDAAKADVKNVEFVAGSFESLDVAPGSFQAVIAIFFLHHLPDEELAAAAARIRQLLSPEGVFYSLDPSRYRLSGAIGKLVVPKLMERYQTPDERELAPHQLLSIFRRGGFDASVGMYDFLSTPVAGLFPASGGFYRATRMVDEILIRTPLLSRVGSNFELIAYPRR